MSQSRRDAAFALMRWQETRQNPGDLLSSVSDRAFVQDLLYTTIRRLRTLRWVLSRFVKTWPKGELESLLYIGAAQVLFMPSIPAYAAVSETVEAAKLSGNPSIPRVVNGVLRNLLRQREAVLADLAKAPTPERESYPSFLYERWLGRFGADIADRLALWHNKPALTHLARPDGTFTILPHGARVTEQSGYAEGAFIVQNPATSLAVRLMDITSGQRVLDFCAAPGGKTIQLAWRGADVTAYETNPRRRARLKENLERVHLASRVRVVSSLDEIHGEEFDRVLVDAPCSNTGVLRRRVDARWNWSEEKLAALVSLQAEILDEAFRFVKGEGLLVYSTCSNEEEENEAQVAHFLKTHSEFALSAQEANIPGTDVPNREEWDGAFAAALKRN